MPVLLPLYYSKRYFADIGEHVMPMRKFGRVFERVGADGLPVELREPSPVSDEDLLRVHTPAYVRAVQTGEPRALAESQKFPWSPALAESVRWTNGGCLDAARAALDVGIAGSLSSGYHHAHADHGEGFCTFNGLVVALEALRATGSIERGLVVDLDLHYGNGTAALLAERPGFFNLSMYGSWYEANRASSDVTSRTAPDTANCRSVAVPNGADGDAYMTLLRDHLDDAFAWARPDLVIYQAGADPYREDPYSPLRLDAEDLYRRDRFVFERAAAHEIPVAFVLAGGYTKDIEVIVGIHTGTVRAACEVSAP